MEKDRTRVQIIGGIIALVGFLLLLSGISVTQWWGRYYYRITDLGYIGIAFIMLGILLVAASFFMRPETTQAYPPPTYQPPAQPYYQAPPPTYQPQQAPPPTSPGVRNCISCGKELRTESKYCPWCGTVAR
jgi:hypothetical protein